MKLFAIWVGKLVIVATRLTKTGGGTTLPGLLAEKIDKNILKKLSQKLRYGAIIITGTNGKTTVSKMLTEILTEEGFEVLNNQSGSNLSRGIASALVASAGIFGGSLKNDIAVLEVDEATMPEVTTKIRPRAVLVTNLFRDQLDRYGELDKTAEMIGKSLRGFSDMEVILNADDPLVSSLSQFVEGPVKYFGLEDKDINTKSRSAIDSKDCNECGHELLFENRYFGHLGHWSCPNCHEKRPKVNFSASNIILEPQKARFMIKSEGESLEANMKISGLYNVYNAVAAVAASNVVEGGSSAIVAALRNFSAAFGRMEEIIINDKRALMLLIKNPTGANQAIETVLSDDNSKKILFALNDNFADGTDISWIWDIDFESFNLSHCQFIASGIRAEEVVLRLKYAGVRAKNIELVPDPILATTKLAEITDRNETGYIFPTYTAMVEVRGHFSDANDKFSELGKVTKHGV